MSDSQRKACPGDLRQSDAKEEVRQSFSTEATASEILSALTETHWRVAVVLTGGGAGFIGHCFARSGASKNFIEGLVPYSREAVNDYLGNYPSGSSASVEAAEQLAQKAYQRCQCLSPLDDPDCDAEFAGLALVAALPTTPPRRGIDRIHVSLITASFGKTWSIELPRGKHTRQSAEQVAEQLALIGLASLTEREDQFQELISHFAQSGITVTEHATRRSRDSC